MENTTVYLLPPIGDNTYNSDRTILENGGRRKVNEGNNSQDVSPYLSGFIGWNSRAWIAVEDEVLFYQFPSGKRRAVIKFEGGDIIQVLDAIEVHLDKIPYLFVSLNVDGEGIIQIIELSEYAVRKTITISDIATKLLFYKSNGGVSELPFWRHFHHFKF